MDQIQSVQMTAELVIQPASAGGPDPPWITCCTSLATPVLTLSYHGKLDRP